MSKKTLVKPDINPGKGGRKEHQLRFIEHHLAKIKMHLDLAMKHYKAASEIVAREIIEEKEKRAESEESA